MKREHCNVILLLLLAVPAYGAPTVASVTTEAPLSSKPPVVSKPSVPSKPPLASKAPVTSKVPVTSPSSMLAVVPVAVVLNISSRPTPSIAELRSRPATKHDNRRFLNKIKKELRRDNDDYRVKGGFGRLLSIKSSKAQGKTIQSKKTPADKGYSRQNGKETKDIRQKDGRRQFDKPSSSSSSTEEDVVPVQPTPRPRVELLSAFPFLPANATYTESTAHSTDPAKLQMKVARFMKFLHKNRNLLRQFIERKRDRQKDREIHNMFTTRRLTQQRGKVSPRLRAVDLSPAQLDMVHARGNHIANLRERGRLCQRYVLRPEGPKYNSEGRIYVPEFVSKENLHFEVTRRPRYILPACCNCCSKSVLGCE